MRYRGQWRSLDIPMGRGKGALLTAVRAFQDEYQAHFAYTDPHARVELYQLGLTAIGRLPQIPFRRHASVSTRPSPSSQRMAVLNADGTPVATPVYQRSKLRTGHIVLGPAIIEQPDATTVIPSSHRAVVDEWENLRITEVAGA